MKDETLQQRVDRANGKIAEILKKEGLVLSVGINLIPNETTEKLRSTEDGEASE